MKRLFALVLLGAMAPALLVSAQAPRNTAAATARKAPAVQVNADEITSAQLRDYLSFIASDQLEGRDTPSRGLDTAALFIATLLARWGVKPGGDDGGYMQKIKLVRTLVDPAKTGAEIDGRSFKYGDNFLAQTFAGTVTGPLVYAGDGWYVKSKGMDAMAGLDVKGKIVVVRGSFLPKGVSYQEWRSMPAADWADPARNALRNGAAGMIVLADNATTEGWDRLKRFQTERGNLVVQGIQNEREVAPLPVITLNPEMAGALLQGESASLAAIMDPSPTATPVPAFSFSPQRKVSFTVGTIENVQTTQNVVGIIPGSDPVLSSEYVAVGAHYDHVGTTATPVNGDTIFNGADDDGSGTVAILSMAEALARSPRKPKRSVIFVWHCAEEKGLWGSEYFTLHPTVPLDKIVTQLNIDMIGRSKPAGDTIAANANLSGPDEIYVIGSKMMSTELGALSEATNQNYLNLAFNYKYDDPTDPNRFFFRSDHYNYAKKGVPIIFYFDGVHQDYHKVGDEVSKIDFAKMEKVARTVYQTMWAVAELPKRPTVDKQLPTLLQTR